jgi:lysophospholipase L1-like esterase
MRGMMKAATSAIVLGSMAMAASAAASERGALGDGARYVAMGSSFASGSGIAPYDPAAPARCQRSAHSYARQLARKRNLVLTDVTCGGATTAHILGAWNELPPQVDALTSDTALVTITIGGNDIGYIGGLIAGSCGAGGATSAESAQPLCRMIASSARSGSALPTATEAGWAKLEDSLTAVVKEVRRRSPQARIMFVDYLSVLPVEAGCAQAPLSPQAIGAGRATAARLARLTADVAQRNGAGVLKVSELSEKRHDACAAEPWVTGFIPPAESAAFVPYHPNRAGMTAVAEALDRQL